MKSFLILLIFIMGLVILLQSLKNISRTKKNMLETSRTISGMVSNVQEKEIVVDGKRILHYEVTIGRETFISREIVPIDVYVIANVRGTWIIDITRTNKDSSASSVK